QQNITQWPIALRKNIKQYLSHLHQQIDISEKQMHWFHPGNMLKIGFSITLHKGKPVKSAAELEKDDEMITRFADGEVQSHVLRVQHSQL
ncbi:MAG: hypothetical protein IRZ29_07185, partial [Thermoflavifilum sp.]|nr:hypothetical protein [Thermoflavifilum sp.]